MAVAGNCVAVALEKDVVEKRAIDGIFANQHRPVEKIGGLVFVETKKIVRYGFGG